MNDEIYRITLTKLTCQDDKSVFGITKSATGFFLRCSNKHCTGTKKLKGSPVEVVPDPHMVSENCRDCNSPMLDYVFVVVRGRILYLLKGNNLRLSCKKLSEYKSFILQDKQMTKAITLILNHGQFCSCQEFPDLCKHFCS